jgi:hypothetical protein
LHLNIYVVRIFRDFNIFGLLRVMNFHAVGVFGLTLKVVYKSALDILVWMLKISAFENGPFSKAGF